MRRKLQRISLLRRRQLRCQASASAFIPSVIGFSASSPSVVGLRLPFPLFVRSGSALLSALAARECARAGEDGILRLCEAENSVLPPLGEELRADHPLLGRRRTRNDESWCR